MDPAQITHKLVFKVEMIVFIVAEAVFSTVKVRCELLRKMQQQAPNKKVGKHTFIEK